jgi:hypothetical protein
MPLIQNPIPKGSGNPLLDKVNNMKLPTGFSVAEQKLAEAQRGLQKGVGTAYGTLAGSPEIIKQGKLNPLLDKVNAIAAGKPEPAKGVLAGLINSPIGKVALGAAGILGAGERAIVSSLEQGANLASGQGFSLSDWANNIGDTSYGVGKVMKTHGMSTGSNFLDGVIAFGGDVALDPLTYISMGANIYAGRGGRLMLATKAAEAGSIAKAPSLAGKLDDIARLGEWALSPAEREALGVAKGLRFGHGVNAPVIRGTGGIAEGVGSSWAKIRALLGDTESAQKIMNRVLPASYGEALKDVGRGKLSADESTRALAHWTATKQGNGASRVFVTQMADRHASLIKEIADSPFRETVVHAVENPTFVVDPAERALADKITGFYSDMLAQTNKSAEAFATKHGIAVPVGVNNLENFGVNHSLSEDAAKWLASQSEKPTNKNFMTIMQNGDLTADELVNGATSARMRKLKAGETWLDGPPLQTGTLQEINARSMEQLGFKWFKEDAPTIMNDYMYSMGKQVQRTAYINRLMDFGVDNVRPLMKKLVPDKNLVAAWESSVRSIKKVQRILKNSVDNAQREVGRVAGKQASALERGIARGEQRVALSAKAQVEALAALDEASGVLANMRTAANTLNGSERSAMETVISSTEMQIEKLRSSVSAGQALVDSGKTELQKTYISLYPKAKNIPEDIEVLKTRIDAASGRIDKQIATLTKTRDRTTARLNRLAAEGKQASREYVTLEAELADIGTQIDSYNNLTNAMNTAPYTDNGLVYMPASEPSQGGAAVVLDTNPKSVLEQGADPSQVIAMRAPADVIDITLPSEADAFANSLGSGIGQIIKEAEGLGGVSNFGANALAEDFFTNLEAVLQNGPQYIDPLFASASPELAHVLESIHSYRLAAVDAAQVGADISEHEVVDLFNNINDAMNAFENTHGLPAGWGDQVATDALGVGLANYGSGMGGSGFLVPAQVFDPAANLGEASLVLGRQSGLLNPENLDSAPSLLSDNAAYLDTTMGRASTQMTDLMASSEAAKSAQQVASQTLTDVGAGIDTGVAQRTALNTELTAKRGQAKRLGAKIESATGKIAEGDVVTVWEKTAKGGRRKVTYTRASAEAKLVELDKSVAAAERKLAQLESTARNTGLLNPATGEFSTVGRASTAAERATRVLNQADILAADAASWADNALPQYQHDLALVRGQIERSPLKGPAGEVAGLWASKTKAMLDSIDEAVRLGDKEMEGLQRVVTQLFADEADLAMLETVNLPRAEMTLTAARSGRLGGKLVDDVTKGWDALAGLGVEVPKDIKDLMYPNLVKLKNPKEMAKLLNAYEQYHRFFKIYATLTPGFSIRNAMSSTFMNYVAGVKTESMIDAVKAATAYMTKGPDAWIDSLKLAPKTRAEYQQAWEIIASTGAGQTVNDIMQPILGGKGGRILNNKATRGSMKFNEGVEFSARFAMALSDVRAGLSFDEAAGRVSRYHFDYTDLSKLDVQMKKFVPFWIWTSRNVPLQMATMWTRPQVYAMYDHLRSNAPVNSNIVMPKWLAATNPIGLGGNWVLNPDLPMNQFKQQIELLSNPKRLAGNLNPLLKLPIELMGSNQLSNDIPFGNKPVEAKGLDLLTALIGAPFGQTSTNAQGKIMINPKLQYATGNLIPSVAKIQRLIPQAAGGKTSYADRQLSSLAGFVGAPVRQVTPTEQRGELINRQFALQNLIKQLRDAGYIPQG